MKTPEQTKRNTEYARQYRARKVAAANMKTLRCTAMLSRNRRCDTPLQSRFVNGETVPFCVTCERKARGICITCGEQPVVGAVRRALYCPLCRKLAGLASLDRYKQTHAAALRRKERLRLADPVKKAARTEYKKLYRAVKPTKIAQYKKAYAERHKDKVLAYHKAYRDQRKAERAARELARYHGTLPPRTCLSCDTVITGRAKKCASCKTAARQHARAEITRRLECAA